MSERPVLTVLCEPGGEPPAQVRALSDRMEVRATDADDLRQALPGSDALLLWDFFSSALQQAWPAADRLRWVHVAAAGVDTLLFDDLVHSEVVVTNARGVFDRPIAEFVLASILARAKLIHESHDLQQQRRWQHRETDTIAGEHVLIIGTGSIGRAIAGLLRAVGMHVRGAGRTARTDADFGDVIASTDLAAHAGWADHLVVAAPLTAATRGLVGADVLQAMKPTAHVVNIARGPILDEPALLDALRQGRLAAASLDVFATEPLPTEDPLWTAPNLVVSPHLSGDVRGWREALATQFTDNALRFLNGDPLHNVVDKERGFAAADPERSRP